MSWRFLAFLPRLPPPGELVGGTQIRPHEVFSRCAERGHRVRVFETEHRGGAPRRAGLLEVAPLPVQRRGVSGLAARLAVMAALLRSEARAARAAGERLCYYAKFPAGLVLKGGWFPAPSHPGGLLIPLARRLGAETWAAVHDLSPEHELRMLERADVVSPRERARARRKARLGAAEQRLLLPQASFVTAVSPVMCELIAARCGVDPRRLAVFWSGVAPELCEPIPAWSPPAPGQPWRVGYLGSPLDVSFSLLARSLARLGREDVVLLLGGQGVSEHAARARACYPRVEVREGVRYAGYADFAREVDLWALPYADDYVLEITWELKVAQALASGRPVVRSEGPIVARTDLGRHLWLAGCDPSGFAEGLAQVLADPAAAAARARAAREDVLRRYRWSALTDELLERLSGLPS